MRDYQITFKTSYNIGKIICDCYTITERTPEGIRTICKVITYSHGSPPLYRFFIPVFIHEIQDIELLVKTKLN